MFVEFFNPRGERILVRAEAVCLIGGTRFTGRIRDPQRSYLCGSGLRGIEVVGEPSATRLRLGGEWVHLYRRSQTVYVRPERIAWIYPSPKGTALRLATLGMMLCDEPYHQIMEKLNAGEPASTPRPQDLTR